MNFNFTFSVKELFISKEIILFLLVAFYFTSCKKCQDCTCTTAGVSTTEEVCKEDMSTTEYNAAILAIENNGIDTISCKCD